jgi:hypothetical protein
MVEVSNGGTQSVAELPVNIISKATNWSFRINCEDGDRICLLVASGYAITSFAVSGATIAGQPYPAGGSTICLYILDATSSTVTVSGTKSSSALSLDVYCNRV